MTYFGTSVESTVGTDNRWMRDKLGIDNAFPVTLDLSLFEAGKHYDTGTRKIKSGLPLGRKTDATNGVVYGPWDSEATDGRAVLDGFLSTDVEWPDVHPAPAKAHGALVWFGAIRTEFLPAGYGPKIVNGIKIHPQSYFRFADIEFSPTAS